MRLSSPGQVPEGATASSSSYLSASGAGLGPEEGLSGAAEQDSLLRGSASIWGQSPCFWSQPLTHPPLILPLSPRQWPPRLFPGGCQVNWAQPASCLALAPSSFPHALAMWPRKGQISGLWGMVGCGVREGEPFCLKPTQLYLTWPWARPPSRVGVPVEKGRRLSPAFSAAVPSHPPTMADPRTGAWAVSGASAAGCSSAVIDVVHGRG